MGLGPRPPKPPQPPTPPNPQPLSVHVVCYGTNGIIRPERASIMLDDATVYPGVNVGDQVHFQLPPGTQYGWHAYLTVIAEGYRSDPAHITIAPDINFQLRSRVVILSRLAVVGKFFRIADTNARWFANQSSAFNAYNRFLTEGEDAVRIVMEQRKRVGFNMLRVWTAYNIPLIGRLIPREHANYYDRIADFMRLCAEYGLYVEWTGFTGPYDSAFGNDRNAMIEHDGNLKLALAPHAHALYEVVNEYDNRPNLGVPYDRLVAAPERLLWAAGSAIKDSMPREPGRNEGRPGYATYHPDSSEWQRKVGHNTWEVANELRIPVMANETVRVESSGENNLTHIFDAAEGAAFFCAGACFHDPHGKEWSLWSEDDGSLQRASAWSNGQNEIAASQVWLTVCQDGVYRRLADRENDNIIREYEKTLGAYTRALQIHV